MTQKFLILKKKRSRHWLQRKTKPSKRRGPKCGVNTLPLQEVAEQYLEKAYRYFLLLQDTSDDGPAGSTTAVAIAEAREDLSKQANLLAWKATPAPTKRTSCTHAVCWSPCSLKFDRGLTCKLNTGFQVLNALVTGGKGIANGSHRCTLAAAKALMCQ